MHTSSVSDPDPYHWAGIRIIGPAGSGSTKGNVDLDPGTKKNYDKLAYKSNKIIKIYFFLKISLILFNIRE